MLAAGRSDLAPRAVQEFGSRSILQALSASWDTIGDNVNAWVYASVGNSSGVAEFLATQSSIPRPMLYGLARALPPDAVPNDVGEDPWVISHGNAVGTIDEAASSYLAAYLLSRALGLRSRCPGKLAQLGFESTHAAAASNLLPEVGWQLLEPRLPRPTFWLYWDRCHRLRVGVADLFVDRDLPPGLFLRLCKNNYLFSQVSTEATDSRRGRNYLKRVRRLMEEKFDPGLAARAGIIDDLLK